MTDKPMEAMSVFAAPMGGFYVQQARYLGGEYSPIIAGFSTLREALTFIERHMTREISVNAMTDDHRSVNFAGVA